MTREEHLQWCKDRALEYVDRGDLQEAIASMLSDISKHPETKSDLLSQLGVGLLMTGSLNTPDEARKFINGFN